ncbi:MAG TPA: hypothetical protein VJ894_04270 [Cryomorphaceae bacterium]|nr:hypothetical protein [Cryomorphaceae bacterium]
MNRFLLLISFLSIGIFTYSQGLEKVFIETYYIANSDDGQSENSRGLKEGMKTVRIWVDMIEGYRLLSVYGAPGHPLIIETSTNFFNDTVYGKIEAPDIDPRHLGTSSLLLDSYIAISGANRSGIAVLKSDDTDGSVVTPNVTDSDPVLIEREALMNENSEAGIPLRDVDGIMTGTVPALVVFGHDFNAFGNSLEQSKVEVDNGAWAVFKGLKGPFPEKNYLLIAQITTDGELSYELNLQLSSPRGETEYYVARNPNEGEFSHSSLIHPTTDQSSLEP